MTHEPPSVERRPCWRDEHLDCIGGLANDRRGVLEIGRNERGEAVGVTEVLRLIDEIPVKVQSVFGLVVNVHLRSDCGRDYLRIVVPSHPTQVRQRRRYPDLAELEADDDRARTDGSATKQSESPDQPENRQKTADGILTFLRENPSASRREIAKAENRQKRPPATGISAPSDRILAILRRNPSASRRDIAAAPGVTKTKVRKAGEIERIGPDKGGHWKVLGEPAVEPDPTSEGDPRSSR